MSSESAHDPGSQGTPHVGGVLAACAIAVTVVALAFVHLPGLASDPPSVSDSEQGFDAPQAFADAEGAPAAPTFADWKRPDGPPKVALQAGHWMADAVPGELENLRGNGASAAGVKEWQVNLSIASEAKRLLELEGIEVEILPTTIPPGYWADLFIAIHADGNPDGAVSGFKVAWPWRDATGKARTFAEIIERDYGDATGMQIDPSVTRNMRGYYAFNWRRYEHALHPMTVAVILETGFLTSRADRRVIVERPELPARAIAEAALAMLAEMGVR